MVLKDELVNNIFEKNYDTIWTTSTAPIYSPLDNGSLTTSKNMADSWATTTNYFTDAAKVVNEAFATAIKSKNNDDKGEDKDMFDFGNMFGNFFKPVAKGYCKMGANGKVAVRTTSGYKTFDINTNRLTNCDNFAFDMDGAFWVVPTFKVERGDIVLIGGKPRAVIEVKDNSIRAFSYEDSSIDEFVPEHHVFMGKTYCYGKIFSPFMNMSKGDNMMKTMMNMAMMNQMFGGNSGNMNGFNPMMFMLMGKDNPFEDMFDGAFDFGIDDGAKESEEK